MFFNIFYQFIHRSLKHAPHLLPEYIIKKEIKWY